mmetsp:Transcript_18274/g.56264  ORF Transcript_18274/g.56264 Transcript_18274/m.56264 type:complete len:484 (-) Transcript_18274:46-1497(-)
MSRDGGGVHVTRRDRSRSRDRRGDAAGREPPRVAAAATPPLVVAFVDQRAEAEAEHDPEYDGALDDSAFTTMGRLSSDHDGVEHVGLTASRGGEKIGSASLVLVDRDRVRNFHAVCDAESADLQAVGCELFDRRGRAPRPRALCAIDGDLGEGCFAYVATFRVDAPDPAWSDVAVEFLQKIRRMTGRLEGCVAYVPEPDPHYTAAEKEAMPRLVPWRKDERSDAAKRAAAEACERCLRRDMLPFLRCGFRVADDRRTSNKVPTLFCAKATWLEDPLGDEADALVPPPPPPPPVGPSGADAGLRELLIDTFSAARYGPLDGTALMSDVGRLVNQGASVVRANALHCAAICEAAVPVVDLLCALGGDVNGRDVHGATPLMVCASTILGMASAHHPPKTGMLRKLLAVGADTSTTDEQGRTALGGFRASARDSEDFDGTFGLSRSYDRSTHYAAIEQLLWPPAGPTEEDERAGPAARPGSPDSPDY